MTKEELIAMQKARATYGLSCVDMNRVCGFGVNQWRLYESGKKVPNKSNSIIIRMVLTPVGMMGYLRLLPPFVIDEMGKDFERSYNKVSEIIKSMTDKSNELFQKLNEQYFAPQP